MSPVDGNLFIGSQNANVASVEYQISRILGRIDNFGNSALGGGPNYTPFDLFHYTGKNTLFNVKNVNNSRNSGYFSVDGGVHNLGYFNNSNSLLANWSNGSTSPFTPTDLLADAVLGYQLTPAGKTFIGKTGLYS